MRVTLRETKVGDVMVHFVSSPVFTPSWAVHGGNLYVGMYPQVVATAARNAGRGGKSLLDNPDFVALRQRLLAGAGGGAKASAIQFLDLPKTAPSSYQTWLMISSFARMGDMAGIESPAILFPPMDVLMQHLSPAGSVSWSDDAGWHLRGVSPFPGSTILAADAGGMMDVQSTALMASILLPSLNRAREQANRVKSASNLRQMGQAVQMFANENKGKFPQEIGQLPATQDLPADVFVNPRKGSPAPPAEARAGDAAAKWVRQNSDYVYVGAGKDYRMSADEVLAYEKPEGLNDGINLLFGDGHVEFLPMGQAQQTIRAGTKGNRPAQRPPARRAPGDRAAPPGGGV
jgi:prepilin-type processing-associated H-X9-DG protein